MLYIALLTSIHISAFDITDWLPTSWVARTTSEETILYNLAPTTNNIIIAFESGTITLDTWTHHQATLHIVKSARTSDDLQHIAISTHTQNDETFTLDIQQPDLQTNINLNIVTPYTTSVTIIGKKTGNIIVSRTPQHLIISTMQGNITIHNEQGNTIDSTTEHGNIEIHCESFNENSSILARAPEGSIILHLPSTLNATIEAQTKQGSIEILYPLAIEYKFPQFNKEYIKQLQKHIEGTIHLGGPHISLHAASNISVAPE